MANKRIEMKKEKREMEDLAASCDMRLRELQAAHNSALSNLKKEMNSYKRDLTDFKDSVTRHERLANAFTKRLDGTRKSLANVLEVVKKQVKNNNRMNERLQAVEKRRRERKPAVLKVDKDLDKADVEVREDVCGLNVRTVRDIALNAGVTNLRFPYMQLSDRLMLVGMGMAVVTDMHTMSEYRWWDRLRLFPVEREKRRSHAVVVMVANGIVQVYSQDAFVLKEGTYLAWVDVVAKVNVSFKAVSGLMESHLAEMEEVLGNG